MQVNIEPLPGDLLIDHGDRESVWRCVHSVLPIISTVLKDSIEYFKTFHDSSSVKDLESEKDVVNCLYLSLQIFQDIFEW